MNSTPVSRREAELIDAIRSRDLIVFGPREVERFLDVTSRNAYRLLTNMRNKGLVHRVARGRYVLSRTYERRDTYDIVSQLEPASYIGFRSALHFHRLTEQVPRTVFVAVTKQKRPLRIHGDQVRFVRIKPATFFGYDRYGEAVVSDPEKTVLDCLRLQEYAGGLRTLYDAIPDDLDIDRAVRYAVQLDIGAVAARLGYVLERRGLLDDHNRDRLRELVTAYAKLDQSGEETNPVADWKLYVNTELADD